MDAPPKLPKRRNLRFAVTLNFLLPGAGQVYAGQYLFGGLLSLAFLVCFVGTLVIFIHGYAQYIHIATSGDLLSSDLLEQIGTVFHIRWLLGLLVASLVVFAISMAGIALTLQKAARDNNR